MVPVLLCLLVITAVQMFLPVVSSGCGPYLFFVSPPFMYPVIASTSTSTSMFECLLSVPTAVFISTIGCATSPPVALTLLPIVGLPRLRIYVHQLTMIHAFTDHVQPYYAVPTA